MNGKPDMVEPDNGIVFGSKRVELLIHATIWMDLTNVMISERSQMQKTYVRFLLYEMSEKTNS